MPSRESHQQSPTFIRFSLKRLVLLLASVSAFCSFVRLSNEHGGEWWAVPITLSAIAISGLATRRWIASAVILATLAMASFYWWRISWSGGFPAAQLEIMVVDQLGQPIEGAALTTAGRSSSHRFHGQDTSDEQGRILVVNNPSGFGGESCFLFGVIRLGAATPRPQAAIEHPDYQTYRCGVWNLLEPTGPGDDQEWIPARETDYADDLYDGVPVDLDDQRVRMLQQRIVLTLKTE